MRSLLVLTLTVALGLVATAGPAVATAPSATNPPTASMQVTLVGGPWTEADGQVWHHYAAPSKDGHSHRVTVKNTGSVPINLTEVRLDGRPIAHSTSPINGPSCLATIEPGYQRTCDIRDPELPVTPTLGEQLPFTITAIGSSEAGTVEAQTTGRWLGVPWAPNSILNPADDGVWLPRYPNETVRISVRTFSDQDDLHKEEYWSSLTSATFGNLWDPDNPHVVEAPFDRTARTGCSYTVRLDDFAGSTINDTITLVTGNRYAQKAVSSSLLRPITVEPVDIRDSAAWRWARPPLEFRSRMWESPESLFGTSPMCAADIPDKLDDVLASADAGDGAVSRRCLSELHLIRQATAAMLNESAYGKFFPAADVESVQSDTRAALQQGGRRRIAALTATYADWNAG